MSDDREDAREDDREIDAWKRARSAAAVPSGFSDRVMAAIARDGRRRRGTRGRPVVAALAASRLARAAAMVLAGFLFLGRLASLFAVFATP